MITKFGVNTGFAVNRFPEPEEWIKIVGEYLGLRYVQLTAEMLSPYLPDEIIKLNIMKIKENMETYDVRIHSTFTGAFTRVNHLASPDEEIRKYWVNWFKKFADISVELGAEAMGSHFGIMSAKDIQDPRRSSMRLEKNIEGWKEIAKHAKDAGLKYLMWEPMSIAREYGETIENAEKIHRLVNEDIALPMKMCLDVDHGDVSSQNPADTDPYCWLERFGSEAPVVHLKQSLPEKLGFWPFTEKFNKKGRIRPKKVLMALEKGNARECFLALELSFREREPYESSVLTDMKESVGYWKKSLD